MNAAQRRFLAPLAALFFLAGAAGVARVFAAEEEEEGGQEATEEKEKPKKEPAGKEAKGKKKKSKKKEAEKFDLETWGQIKEVKGTDFFSLTYRKLNGRKASSVTAFIKVAEGAAFYQDKVVNVTDLKEGDAVWLFGRPVEQETGGGGGLLGVDRQIQNVTAIAAGEALRVNRDYRDPRDDKVMWCEAVVEKISPQMTVSYDGQVYKVTLGRLPGVLVREKTEEKPLKNGLQIEVAAVKTPDRPETKSASDAKKEAYAAKKVILLDRRLLASVYPLLIE